MSRIPTHPFPPAREMRPGRKAWLLCCGQWEGSTQELRGSSILKWMDKQGLLSRDGERVKKGVVRGLSGKRSQYKQGMKVSNPECGNDKGFELAGRKYMKGKQRKKDSGHKGLNTLLLALQMILMSWRVGICVDVSPTGLAMLCVEDVPGEWELGKGFVERESWSL